MRLARTLRANPRLLTILVFVVLCAIGFCWFWTKAGGTVPVVAPARSYQVSFETTDVKNLLANGDVKIAGVKVGRVESRQIENDKARVTISLDPDVAPLHKGARVQIGVKSLIGTSYVDVTDGDGASIPAGSTLDDSAVKQAVDVDELYSIFDKSTNKSLRNSVRSLGGATKDTGKPLDQTLTEGGQLAGDGSDVLQTLSHQSGQLEQLTAETGDLLDQLDAGQGQITTLVSDSQKLTKATASRDRAVRSTMRELPPLIRNVQAGGDSLHRLSAPLAPVARDLSTASPDLNQALLQLPLVTSDLHGLLPSLDTTLKEAPATLDRVPAFDKTLRNVVPAAKTSLADLVPMLAYLAPYGLDLGALFGSFGGSFDEVTKDGVMPIRLTAIGEGPATVRETPTKVKTPLEWTNPYPAPGEVGNPHPFTGKYPRVERTP